MRVLVSILFSVVALFAQDPQTFAPDSHVPDNLSIPARLWKTIDTNKCRSGDAVEMRTLEPVLIANGLVMPEDAKLHGRILGAASRQDNRPSWVVLLVERAEWKQHDVPLHAFVAAQITVKPQAARPIDSASEMGVRQARRGALSAGAPGGYTSPARSPIPRDAVFDTNDTSQSPPQPLDDLRLLKANNGAVFLVSQKPHLRLPSGTMFMLRNQLTLAHEPAVATKIAEDTQ
jgi:hypothetical protein